MFQNPLRLACVCLLSVALTVSATPYLPSTDAQVLERLPLRATDPVARELRSLRSALNADPKSAVLAEKIARRYFDLAIAEGDPRYIGYAEAALRPWNAGPIPPNLRVIRALLGQYRHNFDSALKDLAIALEADPGSVEVHAWRAAIFMVQANYVEATAECSALALNASELFATGCMAYVEATTGKLQKAYVRLATALKRHPGATPDSKLWNLTRLADMARRLGDPGAAEKHFREALGLGITDNFLLAAFADFLIEQKRPAEAAAMLGNWARSDTLLLRLALAEHTLNLPTARARIQALEDRFSEAALRGEQLHLQEEARFRLHLKGDPRGALRLAIQNWNSQREPRDAAILLEAAFAARDRAAAQPALDWLSRSGYEDPALRSIAEALRAAAG